MTLLESLKLMPVLVLVPEKLDWCRVLPFQVHGGEVQLEPGSGMLPIPRSLRNGQHPLVTHQAAIAISCLAQRTPIDVT